MRRARRREPISDFPEPMWNDWEDPSSFGEALNLHMRRHGEGAHRLCTAVKAPGDSFNWATIRSWRRGQKEPQSAASMEMLGRIEERYAGSYPSDFVTGLMHRADRHAVSREQGRVCRPGFTPTAGYGYPRQKALSWCRQHQAIRKLAEIL